MRFLAGIMAVAVAQIALIVYLSAEQQEGAVTRAATEAKPVFDKTADLTLAPISDQDFLVVDRDDVMAATSQLPTVTPVYRQIESSYQRSTAKPLQKYAVETAAFRKPLKVIVSDPYAGKPSSEGRTESPNTAKSTAKTENRSLIAKVLPVIKKPYDWLKTVGSKLR